MLHRVARYDRVIDAPPERVWENVHDWEHLPHLHGSSFRSIERIEQSAAGWRARIGLYPDHEIVLELVIEGDRYVSRTLEGQGAGSEIWTTLTPGPSAEQTTVRVDFDIAGLDEASEGERSAIGDLYESLYTRLWDEDESMILERIARLTAREQPRPQALSLGLRSALSLPAEFVLDGARVRVEERDGALVAYSLVCPHWLGPLEEDDDPDRLRCPWHGYRFDRTTGRSCDGRGLRLAPAPRVTEDEETGEVRLLHR